MHQSIIRILSRFWTYRLLEFNENIEKLTCRDFQANSTETVMQFTEMSTSIRDFRRTGSYTVILASMNYFDSDMSKSTHAVVYFDWKTVIYIYVCGQCRTQFMLPNSSRR